MKVREGFLIMDDNNKFTYYKTSTICAVGEEDRDLDPKEYVLWVNINGHVHGSTFHTADRRNEVAEKLLDKVGCFI